ncbi:hypothetical protein ACUN9Y_03415 [Halomonas sp. V046]|uniref:hypothetical protein n=1 Tax=Halomonas sp. V046 TaxID=3459611 RepID=UPI0040442694
MKSTLKTITAPSALLFGALLIAAVPLTASADPATDRAQALNTEPLASVTADAVTAARNVAHVRVSGSDAMAKARLQLLDKQARGTDFAMTEHDLDLARDATTG